MNEEQENAPETLFVRRVHREYEREVIRRAALERLATQDASPFRTLRFTELLDAAGAEPLMGKMLYRDSLARIFGAPGSGKSFLALDLALNKATGRVWSGAKLDPEPVVYVMAEGQRVNSGRAAAWISKHNVSAEDIDERFISVPDAVLLTEAASIELIKLVEAVRPALVVLDTKNAMMVGEENSASDFAAMRRVLDRLRKASGCCVVLVDHTGHESNRARGSSAGTAAMDTEIRVVKDDESTPSIVTAEVTRDRAGEAGARWAWRLVPEYPAAVLEAAKVPSAVEAVEDTEQRSTQTLPDPVEGYAGPGAKAMTDLARVMIFQTGPLRDRVQIGLTLTEAKRELQYRCDHDPMTVRRAWSALKDMGYLVSTYEEPTPFQERTGPYVWSGPIEPAPRRNGQVV